MISFFDHAVVFGINRDHVIIIMYYQLIRKKRVTRIVRQQIRFFIYPDKAKMNKQTNCDTRCLQKERILVESKSEPAIVYRSEFIKTNLYFLKTKNIGTSQYTVVASETLRPLTTRDYNDFSKDIGDYVSEKDNTITNYNRAKIVQLSNILYFLLVCNDTQTPLK